MHHCSPLDLWWSHGNCFRLSTCNVCSRQILVSTIGSRRLFALQGNSPTWIASLCSTNKCRFGLCIVETMRHHCLCPTIRFAVHLVLVRRQRQRPHPILCAAIPFWSRTIVANSNRWNTRDLFRMIFAPMQRRVRHFDCIRQSQHLARQCDGYDSPYSHAPKLHVYQHRRHICK